MKCDEFKSYKSEILVSIAGPVVNILFLLLSTLMQKPYFFAANMFMLIINLLPIYPLDGGRVLSATLKQEFNSSNVDIVLKIISSVLALIVLGAGLFLLYKTQINFSVLIAGLFISLTADNRTIKSNDCYIQRTKHYKVLDTQNIRAIFKLKNKDDSVIIDILDKNHKYKGSVTAREVLEEIALNGYEINFNQILQKHLLY